MPATAEADEIYTALVNELTRNATPSIAMGIILTGLGLYVAHALGDAVLVAAVGLSLGYACAPSASADLDDLIRRADAASYTVKRRGGGVAAGASGTGAPQAVAEVA